MRADQLFGVCRERFRRVPNPQAENENLSFVVIPEREKLPVSASLGWWEQNNAADGKTPERFEVGPMPTGGQDWTYNTATPYWRRMKAHVAGEGGKCWMRLEHDHTEQTGELYLRCVMFIQPLRADALPTPPLFSLHDTTEDIQHLLLSATYGLDSISVRVTYRDKDNGVRTFTTESMPFRLGNVTSYLYDIRVSLPAEPTLPPAIHVLRPETRHSYVAYLDGAGGSGFRDTPGLKVLCVASAVKTGLIPAGDIRPVRIGIGNKIKEALP